MPAPARITIVLLMPGCQAKPKRGAKLFLSGPHNLGTDQGVGLRGSTFLSCY